MSVRYVFGACRRAILLSYQFLCAIPYAPKSNTAFSWNVHCKENKIKLKNWLLMISVNCECLTRLLKSIFVQQLADSVNIRSGLCNSPYNFIEANLLFMVQPDWFKPINGRFSFSSFYFSVDQLIWRTMYCQYCHTSNTLKHHFIACLHFVINFQRFCLTFYYRFCRKLLKI